MCVCVLYNIVFDHLLHCSLRIIELKCLDFHRLHSFRREEVYILWPRTLGYYVMFFSVNQIHFSLTYRQMWHEPSTVALGNMPQILPYLVSRFHCVLPMDEEEIQTWQERKGVYI